VSLPRWTYYSSIFLTAVLTFDYLFGRFFATHRKASPRVYLALPWARTAACKSQQRGLKGEIRIDASLQLQRIIARASAHGAPNGSPINVLIWAWAFSHTWPVSLPAYFNHRIFSSIQPRFIHHMVMVVAWLPFRLSPEVRPDHLCRL
jgi:hypothetical protein